MMLLTCRRLLSLFHTLDHLRHKPLVLFAMLLDISIPSVLLSFPLPHKTDVKHLHAILEFPVKVFDEIPQPNFLCFVSFMASWSGKYGDIPPTAL